MNASVQDPQGAVIERMVRLTLGRPPVAYVPEFAVGAAYFLLDQEPDGGLESFITQRLGRLVMQLARSTERQHAEYHGEVRGRILWTDTWKRRHSGDYDPALFVCREVRRRYDTPENQLIKYLIKALQGCLKAIPGSIRRGVCLLPGEAPAQRQTTAERLAYMDAALLRHSRVAALHEVSLPEQVTEQHLLRAETSRVDGYAEAAAIYRRYRSEVVNDPARSLAYSGRRVIPLPDHAGADTERWIHLAAAAWLGSVKGGSDGR